MNKTFLVIIVSVSVIFLGLFFIVRSNVDKKSTRLQQVSQDSQDDVGVGYETVYYRESGFDPAYIEVAPGTKIKFINDSNRSMWVISGKLQNQDPLPGFDTGMGVGLSESYEFTFEEVGRWTYHDHLRPDAKGLVHVVAN